MPGTATLIAWIVAAAAVALLLWTLARLAVSRATCNRQRQAIELSWQGYLENLSRRLRSLRSLRAVLAQIRPSPDETQLRSLIDSIYEEVRAEIDRIDGNLGHMAGADDEQWYKERAAWDGGTDFHEEIQQMLLLARQEFESQDLAQFEAKIRAEVEAEFEAQAKELEAELQALNEQLQTAEEKLAKTPEPQPELNEEEQQPPTESSDNTGESEMAIVARYMAELTDNDTLEDADAKLSVAKGRIAHAEKEALETDDPEKKKALLDEAAWEKQRQRWYDIIHTVRRQRRLLDEATGKASELSELGLDMDMEGAQEFQQMEARTKEMRNRIASLTNENKSLSEQLERFSAEQATAAELRETLGRVDLARRNAERELSTVEAMIEEMDDEISLLRRQLHEEKTKQAEIDVEGLTAEKEQAAAQVLELEKENLKLIKEHQTQIDELQTDNKKMSEKLESLKQSLASGEIEGMVPEDEVMELQQAYDKLNADILHFKAAAKQAEINEKETSEKLQKVTHERDELLAKYKELRAQMNTKAPLPKVKPTKPEKATPARETKENKTAEKTPTPEIDNPEITIDEEAIEPAQEITPE